MENTIYPFSVRQLNGEMLSLDAYKNKVLLIVNSASKCGFTPQLKELEELNNKFQDKGFQVLAFPSNDFGSQEPLEGKDIQMFCQSAYGVSFPVLEKIDLKHDIHPLFRFFIDQKGWLSKPRWNFYKYLINRRGELSDFYFPFTRPSSGKIQKRIKELLS